VLTVAREGWVLSPIPGNPPPMGGSSKKLARDSVSVNAKLNRLQREFGDESQQRQGLAAELKQKTQELEALRKEYLELKKGAEDT